MIIIVKKKTSAVKKLKGNDEVDESDKKKKSKKKMVASKKTNNVEAEKEDIKIKISKNVLDNLKIQGLKELCVKNKVATSKCKVRKDYVDLLMPYVEN